MDFLVAGFMNIKLIKAFFQVVLILGISVFLYFGFAKHLAGNKRWLDQLEKAKKALESQGQKITITPQVITTTGTTSQPVSPSK